jgi:hypothetical protein
MVRVFVEARPKGPPEGGPIEDYVVEDHADHVLQTFETQHEANRSECTGPAYARAMREVVARRIIDMAQRGTKDQKELVEGAVRFLAANYRLEAKLPQISSETAIAPAALPELTAAGSGQSPPLP